MTRKAGRKKREKKEETSNEVVEATEKEEEKVEEVKEEMSAEDLMAQMLAMKAELEELKATTVQKVVKAPPKPVQKHICCEIKCKFDDMERARRIKYNELKDKDNSVTLRCPVSGVSVRYKNLTEFPRDDQRIYSEGVDGWFVKYTII